MTRIATVATLLALFLCAGFAQEVGPPFPDDCELAAVVEPKGFFRETKNGTQRFEFTLVVVQVLSGRASEGGEIPVTVGAPLPEGWKEAAHSLAGDTPLRGLVFLSFVGSGKKGRYMTLAGRGDFEPADPSRIEAMKLALEERIRRAIFDLDSPEFAVRVRADKALRRLGLAGEALLRKAVEEGVSPEVVTRAKAILATLPSRRRGGHWVIHQPDVNYPNDHVIIWKSPSRENRAFILPPGTKIQILETVDGDKWGSRHTMLKIRTGDGRIGWVPKQWTRFVKAKGGGHQAPGTRGEDHWRVRP